MTHARPFVPSGVKNGWVGPAGPVRLIVVDWPVGSGNACPFVVPVVDPVVVVPVVDPMVAPVVDPVVPLVVGGGGGGGGPPVPPVGGGGGGSAPPPGPVAALPTRVTARAAVEATSIKGDLRRKKPLTVSFRRFIVCVPHWDPVPYF